MLFLCAVLLGVNPGDLMLTRNAQDNQAPGWWNHSAIYIGDGQVIEAQMGQGVIVTPLKTFLDRYPYILVLRPRGACHCRLAAMLHYARRSIGKPYDVYASTRFWLFDLRCGDNCVSLVRDCYQRAYGYDPCWKIPDDLACDRRLVPVDAKGLARWSSRDDRNLGQKK